MANIVDERGFNQIFRSSTAQAIRLKRRAQAMVEAMTLPEAVERRQGIHILEIGCGMGELAHHLAEITHCRVKGVDLSPQFIEHASTTYQHPNLTFAVADLATSTPVSAQEQFSYIVGNGILHHLYHQLDQVLPRLALWLKPGGRLLFWEPNLHNPYIRVIFSWAGPRRWARLEPDEMAFTARYIRQRLAQSGYEHISATERDFLLPNTPKPLVRPVIALGALFERLPIVRTTAQSLFISAERPTKATTLS